MKAIALSLALLVALPAWADETATMILTGMGEVAAVPDMATIRLGVVTHDEAAAEALAANSEDLARVLSVLIGAGIAPEDMQTARFQVDPIWANRSIDSSDPARIDGYQVTNELSVRVRDLDILGSVLDAVARAGANEFRGIDFGLQDPRPLQDEARRAAVADAEARAALYAEAAGVSIVRIVGISEDGAAPVLRAESRAIAAMEVPVMPGSLSISAQVTITYEIGE